MFDTVDARVAEFLTAHAEGEVTLDAPRAGGDAPRVHAYLMELDQADQFRDARQLHRAVVLRYLVTVWDPEPARGHATLGRIVQAALSGQDYVARLEPLPMAAWAALGVPPQPCLRLEATAQWVQQPVSGPPVLERVITVAETGGRIRGRVLTVDGTPMPGANVTLVAVGRRARTDVDGRFTFVNVPQPLDDDRIEVRAKGLSAIAHAGSDPVEVRLGPKE